MARGRCTSRCYNSQAPAKSCRCGGCGGSNHGSGHAASKGSTSIVRGKSRVGGIITIHTNIGATSYLLGDQTPKRWLREVDPQYFTSGEGAEFVRYTHRQVRALDLHLEEEKTVIGMWQGNLEPAMSLTIAGQTESIEDFAKSLGRRYNQESVLLFRPDSAGPGNLYRIHDVSAEEADLVFGEMLRQGLPGGRYVDGRVEVIDGEGELRDNVAALSRLLSKQVDRTAGHTRFLSREEGDY